VIPFKFFEKDGFEIDVKCTIPAILILIVAFRTPSHPIFSIRESNTNMHQCTIA